MLTHVTGLSLGELPSWPEGSKGSAAQPWKQAWFLGATPTMDVTMSRVDCTRTQGSTYEVAEDTREAPLPRTATEKGKLDKV